jgi:hypothetical protein
VQNGGKKFQNLLVNMVLEKKTLKKKNKFKKSPFHMQPLDLGIRKLILIWHCPI